jgi:LacI family transcriptional regulator
VSRQRGVRIEDVAREAGVSVATVSRVVRDHSDVRDETRERVQEVVRRLGYRPSALARALVSGRSRMIALLVSDIANPFYPQLAKAVERQALQAGYGLVICNTEEDAEVTRRHVERLHDQGIDGIIHASVGLDEQAVLGPGGATPVVFVNRRPSAPRANYIVSDNRAGGEAIGRHLLEMGRTTVGFVAGPSFARNGLERLEGLRLGVTEGPRRGELLVKGGDFSRESGQAAVREWVAAGELPAAIVGVNDSVAIGVMEALIETGRVIPQDVAVAGFDDIYLASSGLIGLTSVAQDIDRMGARAVRALLRSISDPTPPLRAVREILPTRLIVRHSTNPTALQADAVA